MNRVSKYFPEVAIANYFKTGYEISTIQLNNMSTRNNTEKISKTLLESYGNVKKNVVVKNVSENEQRDCSQPF